MTTNACGTPRRWLASSLLLSPFPLTWLVYYSMDDGSSPVCVFRILTGRPCVFCGITHAFAYAAHGEWQIATAYHPLWPLAAVALLGLAVAAIVAPVWLTRLENLARDHWLTLVMLIAVLSVLRAFMLPLPE